MDAVPVPERARSIVTAAPSAKATTEPAPAPAPAPKAEPLNDFALQLGWNAPAGLGGRYLRRIEGTGWEFGLGVALVTFWGSKLSVIARHQSDVAHGLYEQLSFGFTGGASNVTEPVVLPDGTSTAATFKRTPGRTLDCLAGYRFDLTGSYVDLFLGASVNLQGTFLQTGRPLVEIDAATLAGLQLLEPGGLIWGASYGWLF